MGQTTKGLKHRWKQHCRNARSIPQLQPITAAIQQFGTENFVVYTLEENVPKEQLDIREGIWVFRLRSAKKENGYNVFFSGKNERRVDTDDQLIIETYSKLKSIRKTARELGYSRDIVKHRIKQLGVELYSLEETKGHEVTIITPNNQTLKFPSKVSMAKWLIENNIGNSKSIDTLRKRFKNKETEYYGYQIILKQ